jgi:hypothetical protein
LKLLYCHACKHALTLSRDPAECRCSQSGGVLLESGRAQLSGPAGLLEIADRELAELAREDAIRSPRRGEGRYWFAHRAASVEHVQASKGRA